MHEGETQIANPSVSTQGEQEVQEPVPKRCRLLHLQSETLESVTAIQGKGNSRHSRRQTIYHRPLAQPANYRCTIIKLSSHNHQTTSLPSGVVVGSITNKQRSTPPVATFSLRKAKLKHNQVTGKLLRRGLTHYPVVQLTGDANRRRWGPRDRIDMPSRGEPGPGEGFSKRCIPKICPGKGGVCSPPFFSQQSRP